MSKPAQSWFSCSEEDSEKDFDLPYNDFDDNDEGWSDDESEEDGRVYVQWYKRWSRFVDDLKGQPRRTEFETDWYDTVMSLHRRLQVKKPNLNNVHQVLKALAARTPQRYLHLEAPLCLKAEK